MIEIIKNDNNGDSIKYTLKNIKKYAMFNSNGKLVSYGGYRLDDEEKEIIRDVDYYNYPFNDFEDDNYYNDENFENEKYFDSIYDDYEGKYVEDKNTKLEKRDYDVQIEFDEAYTCIIDDWLYKLYAKKNDNETLVLFEEYNYDDDLLFEGEDFQDIFYHNSCFITDNEVYIRNGSKLFNRYFEKVDNVVFYNEETSDKIFIDSNGNVYYIREILEDLNSFDGSGAIFTIKVLKLIKKDYYTINEFKEILEKQKSDEKVLVFKK